jgi:tetratricopeptide (TPR) repeat protein
MARAPGRREASIEVRMTELFFESYEIPAADLGGENPLPVFRGSSDDLEIKLADNVSEEERRRIGCALANRVLPYGMQDEYTRARRPRVFQTLILENECLRARFAPELGGRLLSLFDKIDRRELLECNPVFQPCNVAIRNAWISGGVEWNTSHIGHYFLTVSPVFAARIRGVHGEPALRLYEWDRLHCFPWQIDFFLPEGSRFLFARPRIINPHAYTLPMYWWSNIAVPEHPERRTLVPAADALSHPPGTGVLTVMPMPCPAGYDMTYPTNAPGAGEAFFRIPAEQRKWIAQVDREGKGLVHASTNRLMGRKMFFWGMNPGGRRWQEQLSIDGRAYIELQGGLARTQLETVPMPGGEQWSWTEAYGMLAVAPEIAHGDDWEQAWRAADAALEQMLPREELDGLHARYESSASAPPEEMLARGAGWGALELRRAAQIGQQPGIPPELPFPDAAIRPDEEMWLSLLERGALPARKPDQGPGAYMIQPEWRTILEANVRNSGGGDWLSCLHLGVMRMEARESSGAREAWEQSIAHTPTAWAYRNLSVLAERGGNLDQAVDLLKQAWDAGPKIRPVAQEYADLLNRTGRHAEAVDFIEALPEHIRRHERLLLAQARAALKTGRFEHVEQIFETEFAQIRECETSLTDLWFAYHEQRIAKAEGIPIDDALRERVRRDQVPPRNIDFRMSPG